MTNVCEKLSKNGVDIKSFRLFIIALFHPGRCIPPLPTDINKVFEAITDHGLWDSLHCSPLVLIVQKFGSCDPEMTDWIQNYLKDLKSHKLLTNVQDLIKSELVASTEPSPAKKAKYDLN